MKRFITKRSVLIFFTVLFYLIAWNRDLTMLYGMFSLLAATLVLAHVMPRFSLSKLSLSRTMPKTAFEGDEILMGVSITNTGRTCRYMVEAIDEVPAAGPGRRNPMTFSARLRANETRRYEYPVTCHLRGLYEIGPLKISSSYPLGISDVSRETDGTTGKLLVYPKVFDIASFPLMSGSRVSVGIADSISKSGGAEEFLGIREYRQGDSLRHIHWRSSARYQEMVVKEFELRGTADVSVLIDLNMHAQSGRGKHSTLEYAVKIAASVARYALNRGYSLQLLGYGNRPHIIKSSRGIAHLAAVLEELAMVRADGTVPYAKAIERAAGEIRESDTLVLIFPRTGEAVDEYLNGLGLLQGKRVHPVPIFLEHESFIDPGIPPAPGGSPLGDLFLSHGSEPYYISRTDDLEKEFQR